MGAFVPKHSIPTHRIMSPSPPITADELLRLPDDGKRHELVAGELQTMPPRGWRDAEIASNLLGWLGAHVDEHELGAVVPGGTGFLLSEDPDTVRSPAVAFVSKEQLKANQPEPDGYWPGAPDLAVELVSPDDLNCSVNDRVLAWLAAGAKMVWLVDPELQAVSIYRSPSQVKVIAGGGMLEVEDVVPGFRCPLGEIFGEA